MGLLIRDQRSILQVCPSLLIKKDRGRPADPKARPKAFGEVHVASNIPGVELLEEDDEGNRDEDIDGESYGDSTDNDNQEDDGVSLVEEDSGESGGDSECESRGCSDSDHEMDDGSGGSTEDDEVSDEDDNNYSADGASEISHEEESEENADEEHDESSLLETDTSSRKDADVDNNKLKAKKRKLSDFEGQLNAANKSLRALKKLAGGTQNTSLNSNDGILSNEDFQRIKELKVCIFLMLNQSCSNHQF